MPETVPNMPENMQNESPKHPDVVNTRGKLGKYNANANRHEIQIKSQNVKKKNQFRFHNIVCTDHL